VVILNQWIPLESPLALPSGTRTWQRNIHHFVRGFSSHLSLGRRKIQGSRKTDCDDSNLARWILSTLDPAIELYRIHIDRYLYLYLYLSLYLYLYLFLYLYLYLYLISISISIFISISISISINLSIYLYIYLYLSLSIYIYIYL
jgi:hypothetical protein